MNDQQLFFLLCGIAGAAIGIILKIGDAASRIESAIRSLR